MRIPLVVAMVIGTGVAMIGSPVAAADDCGSEPFEGKITRSADPSSGQPAGEASGDDVQRGLAFDFGSARNTTVYLATYRLDPKELGTTVEAPDDEVVVTIFLRPKSGDLGAGKRLRTPKDQISVLVDSGGGARATTPNAHGKARVLEFSEDQVCFSIDYRDDLQRVKGRVAAQVP
jgi:hypothetical protein